MFAQRTVRELIQIPKTGDCGIVEVWIDRVIWDANNHVLEAEKDAEKNYSGVSGSNYNLFHLPTGTYENYHVVVLRFKKSANFKSDDKFSFEASVNLNTGLDKPVYFLFADIVGDISVERRDDYTVRFNINTNGPPSVASRIGGGVVTAVAMMGRQADPSLHKCVVLELKKRKRYGECLPLIDITSNFCTSRKIE